MARGNRSNKEVRMTARERRQAKNEVRKFNEKFSSNKK